MELCVGVVVVVVAVVVLVVELEMFSSLTRWSGTCVLYSSTVQTDSTVGENSEISQPQQFPSIAVFQC